MKRVAITVSLVLGLIGAIPASADQLPPGGSFVDDDGNVHEANIEAIAAIGITRGCNPPANTFYCPDDSVTRGQMAAFLRRALGLPLVNQDFFTDDDGSTFEGDINAIAAAGITSGCGPDSFCPAGFVKRQQMAAFLVRAFDLTADDGITFSDVSPDNIFRTDISKLATANVTRGCNPPANTEFCPGANVTRAQMASFFARALELDPIQPPPPIPTVTFGPGTQLVPSEVPPGRYTNVNPGTGCYAERLSGLGGTLSEIISNEFVFAPSPVIVDITGVEVAFSADSDCGTWTNRIQPRVDTTASFGPGYHTVGDQIAPGTWRNSSSDGCYWERLSGFTWQLSDILANDFSDAIQTVQISASDVGFNSSNCGTWSKIG